MHVVIKSDKKKLTGANNLKSFRFAWEKAAAQGTIPCNTPASCNEVEGFSPGGGGGVQPSSLFLCYLFPNLWNPVFYPTPIHMVLCDSYGGEDGREDP